MWCLKHRKRITESNIGHHIWGRARVDKVDAIICLCHECHMSCHYGKEPTKEQLLSIMEEARKYERESERYSKD